MQNAKTCPKQHGFLPQVLRALPVLFLLQLLLLPGSSFAATTFTTTSTNYCDTSTLQSVQGLALIGITITGIFIALMYMLGETLSNPRLLVWSKTEVVQVFFSGILVILIVTSLDLTCKLNVGALIQVSNLTAAQGAGVLGITSVSESTSLMDAAKNYTAFVRWFDHKAMVQIRYNMALIELRAGKSRWECGSDTGGVIACLIGGAGQSFSEYSGEYSVLSIFGALLNATTASYLSAMFIQFTLHFVTDGLFAIFLPLGIVLRSIPFMRGLGGVLIALTLSMYIFYPLLLFVNALIWLPSYDAMIAGIPGVYEHTHVCDGVLCILGCNESPHTSGSSSKECGKDSVSLGAFAISVDEEEPFGTAGIFSAVMGTPDT
ncbi:hypothetical protein FJZ26_05570, partial [Candidatus Parvarchaeota archaeon]|nr:hypothetical protein [Candidatus Parvarchaeota archaeon]